MKVLKSLLISLLAIFAPIETAAIAAMAVTLIDLPLGVWAAKCRKEAITSSGLKRTVIKLFVYEIALVLGLLVQNYLIGGVLPLVNLISTLIGVTELASCLENLQDIYGMPFLSKIISVLNAKANS